VDHATVLPLAVINSPEKNCGKSTLLGVVQRLALRPVPASNITGPALFRTIEAWQPTLLLDEADTFAKDNEELRGILNSGHTRKSAYVIRVVEVDGEFEPQQFCTWGAKALAGIGNLPATLMSRAVVLKMRRKLAGEVVANLRHAHDEEFIPTKRKFLRWATERGADFAKLRPEHPALANRDADNWEPLLALAHLAGGEWPDKANLAAVALTEGTEDSQGVSEELLTDIQTALASHEGKNITTTELLNQLCNDDEAPWATYNRGHPLSPRQLAKRLGSFGLKPRTIRDGLVNAKGYVKSAFDEVFSRYLPAGG
jgi:putative DNA primase/helicase